MQIGGMYTIDFAKVSKIPRFSVNIKNGDSKRTIKLVLLKNNEVLNLNNYMVVVAAKKADGKDIFNDVKIIDAEKGMCEVEVSEQMLVLNVDLPCEIVLYGPNGTVSSSSNFVINKITSLRDEESIVSSSEYNVLKIALGKVLDIDYRFEDMNLKKADKDSINGLGERIDNLAKLNQGSTTGDAELIDARSSSEGIVFDSVKKRLDFNQNLIKYDLDNFDFVKGTVNGSGDFQDSNVNIITKDYIETSLFNYKIAIVPSEEYQFYIAKYDVNRKFLGNTGWQTTSKPVDLSNAYYFKILVADRSLSSSISTTDYRNIALYYDRLFSFIKSKDRADNVVKFNNTNWYSDKARYVGFILDNKVLNLSGKIEVVYKVRAKSDYPKGYILGIATSQYDFMSYANPIFQKAEEIKNALGKDVDYVFRAHYDIGEATNYIKCFLGVSVDTLVDSFDMSIVDAYIVDSNGLEHNILESCQILQSYADGVVTTKRLNLELNQDLIIEFDEKYNVKYPLYNSKIGFLGDSITYGLNPDNSPEQMDNPWVKQVSEYLKVRKCINYGINSSSVCPFPGVDDSLRNPMSRRYKTMDDDLDIVGVMCGINDIIYPDSVQIGKFSDRDESVSLYGGLHVLFKGLKTKYKDKHVFVMLYPEYDYFPKYRVDITFRQFLDMIQEVANYYAIPVLDLSKEGGISPYNDADFEYWKELNNSGLHDAHPTQKGANVLAKVISSFILEKFRF